MSAIYNEQGIDVLEIAYQEQETKSSPVFNSQETDVLEVAYQEQETMEKTLGLIEHDIVKIVYNVIYFAFSGKAYLFDGNSLSDFGSPAVVVFPCLAVAEEKAYVVGGLREDGEIEGVLYGYNTDSYWMTADRDYVAYIIAGSEPVFVVDEKGNTLMEVKRIAVAPFLAGWRLVSRKPFSTVLQKLR